MSGGFFGLLDDVAALAKLAAASIDDVGAAAGRASVKAAGVVVDDTAVTPTYVHGLAANRELPVIKRIAIGSLRNKMLIILPVALALSYFVPILVEIILMCGGAYLDYEGAEKIHHRFAHSSAGDDHELELPTSAVGGDIEANTVAGAIRTDFILSAEIMVIALKEVQNEPILPRAVILAIVAVLITVAVYGFVALIVKMDDVGLRMAQSNSSASKKVGLGLVNAMPKVLTGLSTIGTAAMVWVGGHILLVGTSELGWKTIYNWVHKMEERAHEVAGIGGVLGWIVNTLFSALIGLAVGFVILQIVAAIKRARSGSSSEPEHAAAH